MISTDFAPNEQFDDAWLALRLLFQPWRWQKGKELEQLKKQISKFHVSLVLSGRSALYHLIRSFHLPENSQVLIQGFTCEAVALPIIASGFEPAYVDIEKETFSMNINSLKKKFNKNCRVLILQHTFGLTPKYRNQILDFAKKNKLAVIEDLAHGFDTRINFENYYLLSFGRSKPFSSVFGGAIVSPKSKLNFPLSQPSYSLIFNLLLYKPIAYLIKITYSIGIGRLLHKVAISLNLLSREISRKEKGGEYDTLLDKAYPNALAILLLNQFNKAKTTKRKKEEVVNYYNSKLSTIYHPPSTISLLRYPLIIDNRDQMIERARKKNIFLGLWYNQVVAPRSVNLDKMHYIKGSCPVAEDICQKIINLPTNISLEEAKKVMALWK